MKKLYFSLAALLIGVMVGHAQVVIKPAIGMNFTNLSKDLDDGEFKSKVGWQIGGSILLGKKFYVEPGIFYVQKTSEFESSSSSIDDVDFDLSGIRIPVSIGIHLLGEEKSTIKLRVFGGGSAFILTDVKDLDKDDFKSATWGVYAGAGIDFSMVFLEASYEWSLSDVSEDVDNIDVGKTRSVFVQAGIRIEL